MYIINEKDFFDYEEKILLVNYLTGACDVIDSELKIKIKNQRFNLIEQNIMKKLLDRGYVFENKKKYEEYIQNLDTKISIKEKEIVPNFLLIPSYECNFKCSYCYGQKYNHSIYKKNRQWIKYAFEFIDNLANKYLNCNKMKTKKDIVITLMGGEPLMLKNKKEISLIISEIGKRQYTYNIISNGYEIDCYMNCFK